MRRGVAVLAGLALVAVGGAVVATSPYGDHLHDPIPVRGTVGEAVHSRVMDVTVQRARLATALHFPDAERYDLPAPTITSTAVWVVVDVDVTMNLDRASLSSIELRTGGRSYRIDSDLPGAQLSAGSTRTGVAVSGSFVFEVPRSATEGTAELWVLPRIDAVDDSVAVVPIRLDGLSLHHELSLPDAALKDFG